MYESEEEIERLVRDFEGCRIGKADFHHREHLAVAVWYLQTLSREETVTRMRTALLRFLEHHGVDKKKYSDEVTLFWVDAIASQLEGINTEASVLEKCNQIISIFNSTTHTPASRVAVEG